MSALNDTNDIYSQNYGNNVTQGLPGNFKN